MHCHTGGIQMSKNKNKALIIPEQSHINSRKMLCAVLTAVLMMSLMTVTCFATGSGGTGGTGGVNMWTKATEIMKDVYTQVVAISTIAAVVTAAIALLLMNFSKNGRTVDESRAWLKRIIISWAILNGQGFTMLCYSLLRGWYIYRIKTAGRTRAASLPARTLLCTLNRGDFP